MEVYDELEKALKELEKKDKVINDLLKRISNLEFEVERLNKETKRLREEYVILQNASDEVEENKDKEIEKLREENLLLRASEPMSKLAEDYGYKAIWEELKEFMSYENISDLFDKGYEANDFIEKIRDKISKLEGSDKE